MRAKESKRAVEKTSNHRDAKKIGGEVLAGVAQWTEHGPANQRASGSIPSWGPYLGCKQGPQ